MPKLINKTRFTKFANDLWDKIKRKYDNAFVGAEIPTEEKKMKFTKAGSSEKVEVSLADYARLQDRNAFKKDVSVDDADYISTLTIGHENGPVTAANRTTGYRRLTNKNFTDGYISHLRVYVPSTTSGQSTQAHVWVIKKGETQSADTLLKRISGQQVNIVTSGAKKYFDVPINETFEHEVFFVIRTNGQDIVGINNIQSSLISDAININDSFNLNDNSIGSTINWSNYDLVQDKIGYMELHGRMGIVDLSKKLKEVKDASGAYVKHSETTATGGNGHAGKVAKLGDNGKLDATMLPSIAINEYIEITAFTNDVLRSKTYENGDTVVVTGPTDTGARYLCINKDGKNLANLTDAFIKLNDKDGVVTGVNDKTGAVVLNLEATENSLKLKIGNGSGTDVEKSVDIISDAEIEAIINGLN
ncbi:hypothetical protein [uncultured Clostridium sp.]|uniref:hypothetical protein n=1 Tax=uncultured Clostridium sp. TaxID=59620 RepID=UPI002673175A|nr:hypothetical protein [uncultured Clostridium sp.]